MSAVAGDPRDHARTVPLSLTDDGLQSAATGLRSDFMLCGNSDLLRQMVAVIYFRRLVGLARGSAAAGDAQGRTP